MDLNSSTLSFKIRKQTHVLSMFLFPVGEQAEFCNPCNLIGFDSGGGGGGGGGFFAVAYEPWGDLLQDFGT